MMRLRVTLVSVAAALAVGMPVHAQSAAQDDRAAPLRTLAAPAFRHAGRVHGLAFLDGGKKVATASDEGAFVFDAATGKRLQTLATEPVWRVVAARDGVMVGQHRGLALYAPDATERWRQSSKPGALLSLAVSADGEVFANSTAGSNDIRLGATSTGQAGRTLTGHKAAVYAVAFHPDGKSLFSGAEDGTLRQWDLATGKEIRRLVEEPGWYPTALAVSGDGKALAIVAGISHLVPGKMRCELRLLDTTTLEPRHRFTLPEAWSWATALSADGRYVAAACTLARFQDSHVRLWNCKTGEQIPLDQGNAQSVHAVAFSTDGKTLASAGDDGVVRLWNTADGAEHPLTRGPAGSVNHLCIAPSGEMLATATDDGTITLWDAIKGKPSHTLRDHQSAIGNLLFSPDGTLLLATTSAKTAEPAAHLWDTRNGKWLRVIRPAGDAVAIAPNGKTLAGVDGQQDVNLWTLAGETQRGSLAGHESRVLAVAWSPDGRLVATTTAKTVRLWYAMTAICQHTCSLQGFAPRYHKVRMTFSPDGLLLFISHGNGSTMELIETATGQPLKLIDIERSWPSPSWPLPGAWLLTSPAPGKFRTLALATGQAAAPDVEHGGLFSVAELSPDRRFLALGYADGRLELWRPPPLPPRQKPATIDEAQLDMLWQALDGPDARKAFEARGKLCAAPGQAVQFLRRHLRPQPPLDDQQKEWINKLDSPAYKQRQQAMTEVAKMSQAVEPILRALLEQKPTLELRQRAESLLQKVTAPPTGETLRCLRAISVLQAIDSEEARTVLRELAGGAAGDRITEAARAALGN
jgi:WD40 repeat protein